MARVDGDSGEGGGLGGLRVGWGAGRVQDMAMVHWYYC